MLWRSMMFCHCGMAYNVTIMLHEGPGYYGVTCLYSSLAIDEVLSHPELEKGASSAGQGYH